MNLIEILKAKGISDDVIQAVQEDMKTNKIFTASEENLDIRYGKLKTQHEGTAKQLEEANATIEALKKSTKGIEEAQNEINAHKQREEQLQKELEQTKINAAIKIALLSSKAVDVDYLAFKLNEKMKADGETITLDDNGDIKGWNDKLDGLKTQFPKMFESSSESGDGYKVLDPNELKKGDGGEAAPTKESFRAMTYEQRVALKQKNEALYKQLAK